VLKLETNLNEWHSYLFLCYSVLKNIIIPNKKSEVICGYLAGFAYLCPQIFNIRIMETIRLREELFREMNPLLDSDVMLRKMIVYVRSLFASQQLEQEAAQEKGYKVKAVSPDIEKWSGCASFTQEEIDSDPRLKSILTR